MFPVHKAGTDSTIMKNLRKACQKLCSDPDENDVKDLYLLSQLNKEVKGAKQVKQKDAKKTG